MRISNVGQSQAIIGAGVLIRDYRLTHITFETPYDSLDIKISELKLIEPEKKEFLKPSLSEALVYKSLSLFFVYMGVNLIM